MKLTWDEAKRLKVLTERGLEFAAANEIFVGAHFTDQDLRQDYNEDRFVTTGFLGQRLCVLVWTPRDNGRHIISLRKANDREQKNFERRMD